MGKQKKRMPLSGKEGTEGFAPQLSGHGKATASHTSSFNAKPPSGVSAVHAKPSTEGQEEGGRARLPSTSSNGRIL